MTEDIIEIEPICAHTVTTRDNTYTRYGPEVWTIRMDDSQEPVHFCEELEELFQAVMDETIRGGMV